MYFCAKPHIPSCRLICDFERSIVRVSLAETERTVISGWTTKGWQCPRRSKIKRLAVDVIAFAAIRAGIACIDIEEL
jgi:hypothetical protein